MYFLASEHSFRMGLQSLIMKAMAAPIGRVKGATDASAVLGMLRRLKSGKNICFFPEGERSFDDQAQYLRDTLGAKIVTLTNPDRGLSSTLIRNKLANHESLEGILPKSVEDYIWAHGLYGTADLALAA